MLDLVDPVFRVRHFGAGRRDAGVERGFSHTGYLGTFAVDAILPCPQSDGMSASLLIVLKKSAAQVFGMLQGIRRA